MVPHLKWILVNQKVENIPKKDLDQLSGVRIIQKMVKIHKNLAILKKQASNN